MKRWLRALLSRSPDGRDQISNELWQATLTQFPFLSLRSAADQAQLRRLTREFLRHKEFHGVDGLAITDAMAVAIASQACLPILKLGTPAQALQWYDDFVGIVVHPDEVLAQRSEIDDSGVVHDYQERLTGEAMVGGPVTLSWLDVWQSGASAAQGYNVVIHEFIHKIDMRDGMADGCPPLPPNFMGAANPRIARQNWLARMDSAFALFSEQVVMAERFSGAPTWLDPYGTESIDEFFAVTCEAYFTNRAVFSREFPSLLVLYDAFFNAPSPAD
ncbi:zinc-dependent peptidase [Rhodoferax sp.]|uniref:M90 family metallopeptidase n=1 Tax=Rhodoferax sp. TaxID=50421 RepID=UPI00275B8004|nr:zinc-dependent peptidase [Rhodoferax sp.]